MKLQTLSLTAALALAIAAPSANAGVKDWLKDKKAQLQGQEAQEQPKTLGTVQVQGQRQAAPATDKQKTMEAAGKGCGIGALIGQVAGIDGTIGCAAGGLIGGAWSHRKQLKEARELESQANAAGMKTEVSTQQVQERGKKTEQLKTLTISYEPADMLRMDEKTQRTMQKLSGLLAKAKSPFVVRFEGTDRQACEAALSEVEKSGALQKHEVIRGCGKGQHKITLTAGAQ